VLAVIDDLIEKHANGDFAEVPISDDLKQSLRLLTEHGEKLSSMGLSVENFWELVRPRMPEVYIMLQIPSEEKNDLESQFPKALQGLLTSLGGNWNQPFQGSRSSEDLTRLSQEAKMAARIAAETMSKEQEIEKVRLEAEQKVQIEKQKAEALEKKVLELEALLQEVTKKRSVSDQRASDTPTKKKSKKDEKKDKKRRIRSSSSSGSSSKSSSSSSSGSETSRDSKEMEADARRKKGSKRSRREKTKVQEKVYNPYHKILAQKKFDSVKPFNPNDDFDVFQAKLLAFFAEDNQTYNGRDSLKVSFLLEKLDGMPRMRRMERDKDLCAELLSRVAKSDAKGLLAYKLIMAQLEEEVSDGKFKRSNRQGQQAEKKQSQPEEPLTVQVRKILEKLTQGSQASGQGAGVPPSIRGRPRSEMGCPYVMKYGKGGCKNKDCEYGHWEGLDRVEGYKFRCKMGDACRIANCEFFHKGRDKAVQLPFFQRQ
jgi:hypothetical protein